MANRYDPLRQTEQQVEEERGKGTPAQGHAPAERGDAPAERSSQEFNKTQEQAPSAKAEQQQDLDPVEAYIQALPDRVPAARRRFRRRQLQRQFCQRHRPQNHSRGRAHRED